MDLLPIAFLLLIVLVSGGIAYLADELGRKLGKKRLTIGKLRPRHTARLGVILSGMAVSLVTILVIAALSKDVRQWILQGRRAVEQRNAAYAQLGELRKQEGEALDQNRSLLQANLHLQELGRGYQGRVDKLRGEIEKSKGTILNLRSEVKTRGDSIRELDEDLRRNNEELLDRKRHLQVANGQLQDIRRKIAEAQRTRNQAVVENKEIKDKNNELFAKNAELEKNVDNLKAEIDDLTQASQTAREALEATKAELIKARNQLAEATTKLSETQNALAQSQAQVSETQAKFQVTQHFLANLTTTFNKSRNNPMTYRSGEEVERMPVPAGLTEDQAESTLVDFLRKARTTAADRGAAPTDKFEAADIVDHVDQSTGDTIPSERIRHELVRQIAGASGDLVLVGYSTLNAFAGEPVSLEVQVFPNPVVYRPGQVLAESKIDGKRDPAQIFDDVSKFLGTKVKARAKQDRMLARLGSDEQFGSLTPEEIFDLVGRVRAADRTVIVVAQADGETRAADPLKLKFKIR